VAASCVAEGFDPNDRLVKASDPAAKFIVEVLLKPLLNQREGVETPRQLVWLGGPWMTQIEKIIIVVLGLISVSLLAFILRSWTSQTAPVAAAPGAAAAANVDPSPPKCDSAEAVATLKSMALEKINDKYRGDKLISFYSRKYLGKNPVAGVPPNMGDPFSIEEVTMDSFRSQGNIGTGSRCAAQIGVEASGKKAPSEISVEYTIEPTTDGKTIVSARFIPNS
jgi:hypothetical protein